MNKFIKKFVSRNRADRLLLINALLVLGTLIFTAGCTHRISRVEHAGAFPGRLTEKTIHTLPDTPITLGECIDIALANNLDLQILEIQKRLASLDRKSAFGNFLPNIGLRFSFSATDKPQLRQAGGSLVQMSDQEVANLAIELQQPIFLPQAWYLYDMRQKGEDISNLVLQRTRQQISLYVTSLYFACLSLEEAEAYLKTATISAEALLRETKAFEREGLVLPSQRREVETLLLESRLSLKNIHRISMEYRANLLEVMGLSPFADIKLKLEMPFAPAVQRELSEDVLEALINRLELHIDDRTLEIRKQEIRSAIAAFLPQIFGIGSFSHGSDSFLRYSNVWSYGVSAIMTVFDGFQNVFGYRAAREREKAAFIEREQTCMMIMLEVLSARNRAEQASDQLQVATMNAATAEESFREAQAQWNEGLLQLSEILEDVTNRDQARFMVTVVKYQQQVALATLADVLGRTKKEP
ncbi:MAG: TolC family protein [Acidobacteria bacterium]|nr:TolC family protein [Acidobacteriota bacterium]